MTRADIMAAIAGFVGARKLKPLLLLTHITLNFAVTFIGTHLSDAHVFTQLPCVWADGRRPGSFGVRPSASSFWNCAYL